ncbi:multicopper oxidase family protein [Streptomyces qinzhouensis]|uniref:Multicopper oxidase CueO n=1 Tax=Streptomyces qinzhouensis TaxID=2599401 RepID=A0A5B8INB8_9ACTN|nr:multicopper oxidase family protein [Streptomyces qinzhouensis]QDY80158.1 multicopper oxidase family protein [Streptomyces qinzhouensis]
MVARRRLLGAGIATAATGLTGASLIPVFSANGSDDTSAQNTPPPIVPFQTPLPLIPVAQPVSTAGGIDRYDINVISTTKQILPGFNTQLLTYGGQFPGATIKARENRPVIIRQRNGLSVPIARHLHGASVAPESDGGPMDTIAPNAERIYTYPNRQPHASLWYHDHAHHLESENVYRGLQGSYLISDDIEDDLPLPKGAYDVVIQLRDARFDAAGQLVYTMGDRARTTLLTNGVPYPYFQVAARKYRFRLANTSNMRFFTLRLSGGAGMVQIGSDGGLLPAPHVTQSLFITSGERADVVIDFSGYPIGSQVFLESVASNGSAEQVMRFDVTRTAADPSSIPSVLRTLPPLPTATAHRTIVMRMDEDGRPSPQAYMDDKVYDHHRVDAHVRFGASEIWTVTNANTLAPHNFHMHLVQFRVIERNGVAPGPAESGLKDTVAVMPGETVKLQATFDTYAGEFVYHCHMLDHSAMGMMATMKIA